MLIPGRLPLKEDLFIQRILFPKAVSTAGVNQALGCAFL